MSEINIGSEKKGRRKRSQPSRTNLRVDFTPMVDMNMLLITFFMFCTTLAAPQVMDIVMPSNASECDWNPAPESKTTTLLIGENQKIYYYYGIPKYDDPEFVKETSIADDGLRNILLNKNGYIVSQVHDLRKKRAKKEITEKQFKEDVSNLKKAKDGQIVVIKPTEKSSYRDLVNILDEMQICSIGRYVITDIEDSDKYFLENL